jgi:hypothetical protein
VEQIDGDPEDTLFKAIAQFGAEYYKDKSG